MVKTIEIDKWIAAFDSELHAKDCAVNTPKIEFSEKKILAERFFNNLSNDIHRNLPFILIKVTI